MSALAGAQPAPSEAHFATPKAKSPVPISVPLAAKKNQALGLWALLSSAETVSRAVQLFHQSRNKDPRAFLFPEFSVNILGYTYLQSGEKEAAAAVFQLNVEAYPSSANNYDSLSDAYLALGRDDDALAAEQKCLELLANDKISDQFKVQLRRLAEEKIGILKTHLTH